MFWQTPNQLSIATYKCLASCRALGLINKVVTGPLWHLLESSDISITEMNDYYQVLVSHMEEWSVDASKLLHGEAVLYPEFPLSEDANWNCLITPSDSDSTTQVILQIIFMHFQHCLVTLARWSS